MKDLEKVIEAVAEVMDLSPCQILCKRRYQETIDARWMVVFLLRERGFYASRIALWMGMSSRNVNLILTEMHNRLSNEQKLRSNLELARKYLLKKDSDL